MPQIPNRYPPVPKYQGNYSSFSSSLERNSLKNDSLSKLSNKTLDPIKVFPNPSEGVFNFQNVNGYDRFEIYNSIGSIVKAENILSSSFKVDLSGIDGGIYYILLISKSDVFKQKLFLR